MIRFALIPFAVFASACADSPDLAHTADDLEQEFKDMLDNPAIDAECDVHGPNALGAKVVQLAWSRYSAQVQKEGCDLVGAAYGTWEDQGMNFRGQLFQNSAMPMDGIMGRVVVTANGTGELSGIGTQAVDGVDAVYIEGDWKGTHLDADVLVKKGARMSDLVLIGNIHGTFDQQGYFVGALADCD
ncbi:MAG: hypothetical protein VX944_16250 [Myxococcota bacterium]|nr:hypothetical protein [Myxococcota bacterium]MEC9391624.1 hypothetical protein [Myxococcota bacterium]